MKREQQIFVREEESETKVMTMGEPLDKTNYDTTLFFSFSLLLLRCRGTVRTSIIWGSSALRGKGLLVDVVV